MNIYAYQSTFKMKILFTAVFFVLFLGAQAQTLPPIPQDAKVNPHLYPSMEEMSNAYEWATEQGARGVKFYSKEVFSRLTRDQQAELEGYGFLVVFEGAYLTNADIQAFEARRGQIVSRTYQAYKVYLYEHNRQRFVELFE